MIGDAITRAEAAAILGIGTSTLRRRLEAGWIMVDYSSAQRPFSREVVEAIALTEWTPSHHKPGGYWATTDEVMEILGVSGQYIGRITRSGRLPGRKVYVNGRGHWLYRRMQVEVIAHARLDRTRTKVQMPRAG